MYMQNQHGGLFTQFPQQPQVVSLEDLVKFIDCVRKELELINTKLTKLTHHGNHLNELMKQNMSQYHQRKISEYIFNKNVFGYQNIYHHIQSWRTDLINTKLGKEHLLSHYYARAHQMSPPPLLTPPPTPESPAMHSPPPPTNQFFEPKTEEKVFPESCVKSSKKRKNQTRVVIDLTDDDTEELPQQLSGEEETTTQIASSKEMTSDRKTLADLDGLVDDYCSNLEFVPAAELPDLMEDLGEAHYPSPSFDKIVREQFNRSVPPTPAPTVKSEPDVGVHDQRLADEKEETAGSQTVRSEPSKSKTVGSFKSEIGSSRPVLSSSKRKICKRPPPLQIDTCPPEDDEYSLVSPRSNSYFSLSQESSSNRSHRMPSEKISKNRSRQSSTSSQSQGTSSSRSTDKAHQSSAEITGKKPSTTSLLRRNDTLFSDKHHDRLYRQTSQTTSTTSSKGPPKTSMSTGHQMFLAEKYLKKRLQKQKKMKPPIPKISRRSPSPPSITKRSPVKRALPPSLVALNRPRVPMAKRTSSTSLPSPPPQMKSSHPPPPPTPQPKSTPPPPTTDEFGRNFFSAYENFLKDD